MIHKLIPILSLLWALGWWYVSAFVPPPDDTGDDVFAALMAILGLVVFVGYLLWAMWLAA